MESPTASDWAWIGQVECGVMQNDEKFGQYCQKSNLYTGCMFKFSSAQTIEAWAGF